MITKTVIAFLFRSPGVRNAAAVAVAVAVAIGCASLANAQVVERRPRSAEPDVAPTTFVGGGLAYASPRGEFKDYVRGAFGLTGHLVHAFDPEGILAVRAELGYLNYGNTTNRQALGGGALGLITVDVTTSNNIVVGGLGLQLMAPAGTVRPYLTGSVGFSYFFTQSSVEGTSNIEPFAETENFSDGGFTTLWGGGLYIPVRRGLKPISIDLGAQMHSNSDIQYLTKSSIVITNSSAPPVITPVRSAADFITFRLGITVGIR
ncbi:MAG: hypothetical protein O2973_02845 [Gemmatimonadetes bacterium]|nr:hypothetical protein [Gemmatimonadota bacterium]